MKCYDCENYKPKVEEPTWTKCFTARDEAYSNEGGAGPDCESYPRLRWFVKGIYGKRQRITRAAFLSREDAELFLAALPEEER